MTRATRRLLQHGVNPAVVTSCRWASHCHPARNARTGVARTDLPSSANVGKRHRQTRTTVDRVAGIAGCLLLGWLLYDAGFDVVERCLGRMGYGAALAAVPYTIASLCDALGWRAVLVSRTGNPLRNSAALTAAGGVAPPRNSAAITPRRALPAAAVTPRPSPRVFRSGHLEGTLPPRRPF